MKDIKGFYWEIVSIYKEWDNEGTNSRYCRHELFRTNQHSTKTLCGGGALSPAPGFPAPGKGRLTSCERLWRWNVLWRDSPLRFGEERYGLCTNYFSATLPVRQKSSACLEQKKSIRAVENQILNIPRNTNKPSFFCLKKIDNWHFWDIQ